MISRFLSIYTICIYAYRNSPNKGMEDFMEKHHIPYSFILQDGKNDLHEKVDKDSDFNKYYNKMNQLIEETIMDDSLKAQISEASRMVYIFAEIAAYKEGFKEGIRFLTNILSSVDESANSSEKERDLGKVFERYLADYKPKSIADVNNSLVKNADDLIGKGFKDTVQDFVYGRIDEIITAVIMPIRKYTELSEKSYDLYKMIGDILPEDHKSLIAEYENTELLLQGIAEEAIYKQGLKDGATMKCLLTEYSK